MAPKDPNEASRKRVLDTERDIQNKTSSTTSEKMHLIDLRFNQGELIQYGQPNKLKFAIKIASHEYIDAETRRPILERDIAPYLGNASLSKAISFRDFKGKHSKIADKLLNHKAHTATIDFETAVVGKGEFTKSDLFSTGLADITSDGKGSQILRGREYYTVDIFDQILSKDKHISDAGYGKFATASKNVKAGYFKSFQKLAAKNNISLGSIDNMDNLVKDRERLGKLVNSISSVEMFSDNITDRDYRKIGYGLGVSRSDIKVGLGRVDSVAKALSGEFNIGESSLTSPTLAAFNPGGVDDRSLNLLFGRGSSEKMSMVDIRGNQLFINSTIMPHLTDNAHVTLGPEMDDISHRLNMSNKQREAFFNNAKKGIAGFYSKSTSAEDFEKNLRYATGRDNRLKYSQTAHTAGIDAAKEAQLLHMQRDFTKTAIKESLHPELHIKSVRARYQAAWLGDMAMNAMAEDQHILDTTNPTMFKKNVTQTFNRHVDINKISKSIQDKMERSASAKIEKGFLNSNIKQLGGSTISHLLGGALLFTGVRSAVQKARENFVETRANSTEGIRHESILTNVRRLALTDFGSGYLRGMSPAIMGTLKQLFKNKVNDPTGTGRIIKDTLGKINNTFRDAKGNDSLFSLLQDKKKVAKLSDKILGFKSNSKHLSERGLIEGMSNRLLDAGRIEKETANLIGKMTGKVEDLAAEYYGSKNPLIKKDASKSIGKEITKSISDLFVSKKVVHGATELKFKAPAIALGLGGAGALAVMLSRGRYDQHEMNKELPSMMDKKYSRQDKHQQKVRQSINDIIRSGNNEGIKFGSRERERSRYSYTDFGSGYINMGLKNITKSLISIAKRGKDATVEPIRGTFSYARDSVKRTGARVKSRYERYFIPDKPKTIIEGYVSSPYPDVDDLAVRFGRNPKTGKLRVSGYGPHDFSSMEPENIQKKLKKIYAQKHNQADSNRQFFTKEKANAEVKKALQEKKRIASDKLRAKKRNLQDLKYGLKMKNHPKELPPHITRSKNAYRFTFENIYNKYISSGDTAYLGSGVMSSGMSKVSYSGLEGFLNKLKLRPKGGPEQMISKKQLEGLLKLDYSRQMGKADKCLDGTYKINDDIFTKYKYRKTRTSTKLKEAAQGVIDNIKDSTIATKYQEYKINKQYNAKPIINKKKAPKDSIRHPDLSPIKNAKRHADSIEKGVEIRQSGLNKVPKVRPNVDDVQYNNKLNNNNNADLLGAPNSKKQAMIHNGDKVARNLSKHGKNPRDKAPHGSNNIPYIE
jgi:hypothetical protein